MTTLIAEAEAVERTLDRMAQALTALLQRDPRQVAVIGVRTGGCWVAEALTERLAGPLGTRLAGPPGCLDPGFYRDDFDAVGVPPAVRPSHLPVAVDDRQVLLVDDVLYTGRTIRAAINGVFDYGRPALVRLAVLAIRPGQELPIVPDVAGGVYPVPAQGRLQLQGPESLSLHLVPPAAADRAPR